MIKTLIKKFTLIPDLLGVHVLFDCEQRHLFRITITHDFDDDKVHYRELNNSTLFKYILYYVFFCNIYKILKTS